MKSSVILLLLLAASIAFGDDIPFSVSVNSKDQLEIGKVAPLHFIIRSETEKPVIILEIRPDQPCEDPINFVKTLYGKIEYDEKLDSYFYDSLSQQQSIVPVLEGYLAPGGTLPISVSYRPFRGVETFQISYIFAHDQKVYSRGGSERASWFGPGGKDFSQVILSRLPDAERKVVPLTVSFQPIRGTESSQCYCETLGAPIAVFPASLCKDWDTGETVTFRVGEKQEGIGPDARSAGHNFLDEYPVHYGDGMYTHGEFIEITPQQARSFVEKIRGKYLMNRVFYFFSRRYYDLEPVP